MGALIILTIVLLLGISNLIVFKVTRNSKKKLIWSGVIFIISTPIIFFITAYSISPFDPYGFGTGIISGLSAIMFFINGIIVILIGLLTKSSSITTK